jgi:hypothetical protein
MRVAANVSLQRRPNTLDILLGSSSPLASHSCITCITCTHNIFLFYSLTTPSTCAEIGNCTSRSSALKDPFQRKTSPPPPPPSPKHRAGLSFPAFGFKMPEQNGWTGLEPEAPKRSGPEALLDASHSEFWPVAFPRAQFHCPTFCPCFRLGRGSWPFNGNAPIKIRRGVWRARARDHFSGLDIFCRKCMGPSLMSAVYSEYIFGMCIKNALLNAHSQK